MQNYFVVMRQNGSRYEILQCEEVDENLELRIHFISTTKPFKRNINGVYKS